MLSCGKEVLLVDFDETAVATVVGEHGDGGVAFGGRGGGGGGGLKGRDLPAEDGGIEGCCAFDRGAGDFGPGYCVELSC